MSNKELAAPFPLLCRAWGETDLPAAYIAYDPDDLTHFICSEWLGDPSDPRVKDVLNELMTFPWGTSDITGDDTKVEWEFEIGGVSFERVYETAPRAALAAQPVATGGHEVCALICEQKAALLLSGKRTNQVDRHTAEVLMRAAEEMRAAAPSPEARQHHEQQPDGTVTAVDPAEASKPCIACGKTDGHEASCARQRWMPEASKPVQAEAPRWLNVESAMEDPVFQQARAIMGTENWFQDNALRNALNYVLRAAHSPASGVVEREALALDIKSAIAELASGAVYPDLLEAIDKLAALSAQPQTGLPDYYISGPYTVGKWAGWHSVCETATARVVHHFKPDQPQEVQKPVGVVESAAAGAGGFHCRLTGSMPRVGDAVYTTAQPEQVAQDREDAELFAWYVGDARTESNELAKLELRRINGETASLDEYRDAIRAARASGKGGGKP